jgi:hypothetical protein
VVALQRRRPAAFLPVPVLHHHEVPHGRFDKRLVHPMTVVGTQSDSNHRHTKLEAAWPKKTESKGQFSYTASDLDHLWDSAFVHRHLQSFENSQHSLETLLHDLHFLNQSLLLLLPKAKGIQSASPCRWLSALPPRRKFL